MWASTPRSSRWLTTTLVRLPEMSTSTPSMRRIAAAPPPTLTPRTSIRSPPASTMRMSTVLGCSTPAASACASVARVNANSSPAPFAKKNESRMRRSSASSPSKPATRALSVPCPVPVWANEPYSVMSACAGAAESRRRAIRAMRSAPAVCELEGPTMMGPMISRSPRGSMGVRFLLQCAADFAVESMVAQHPRLSPDGLGGSPSGGGVFPCAFGAKAIRF